MQGPASPAADCSSKPLRGRGATAEPLSQSGATSTSYRRNPLPTSGGEAAAQDFHRVRTWTLEPLPKRARVRARSGGAEVRAVQPPGPLEQRIAGPAARPAIHVFVRRQYALDRPPRSLGYRHTSSISWRVTTSGVGGRVAYRGSGIRGWLRRPW
jgi:hypothetical protein